MQRDTLPIFNFDKSAYMMVRVKKVNELETKPKESPLLLCGQMMNKVEKYN